MYCLYNISFNASDLQNLSFLYENVYYTYAYISSLNFLKSVKKKIEIFHGISDIIIHTWLYMNYIHITWLFCFNQINWFIKQNNGDGIKYEEEKKTYNVYIYDNTYRIRVSTK